MIKLVLFDLDGVLVDTKKIHYESLNEALGDLAISESEHLSWYDGLTTRQKLDKLGLSDNEKQRVYEEKQRITYEKLDTIKRNEKIVELFEKLDEEGHEIGVCSNAIKDTVDKCLSRVGVIDLCSFYLSADDVDNPKPHPEIYWKAMSFEGVLPEQTVIIEDSPIGLLSGYRSGANVIRVSSPEDVNVSLMSSIKVKPKKHKWVDKKLNVVIPMAGAGSRFADAGYTFPKPLIDVNGKPMIQTVVENLGLDANYTFIVQKDHIEKYNIDKMLSLIAPECNVIWTEGVTEGAACTALLASRFIDNDDPLFFANSDQFVEWDVTEFMYSMNEKDADGGIVTFESTHPKWSFAKTDEYGLVTEVAEKNPISNLATVGFYYWKHGSDFVKYAKQMIEKDIRVNNEFYVCPVFNEAIADSKRIYTHNAKKMWGLGTPEDLEAYLCR